MKISSSICRELIPRYLMNWYWKFVLINYVLFVYVFVKHKFYPFHFKIIFFPQVLLPDTEFVWFFCFVWLFHFTGLQCEAEIDECLSDPCSPEGTDRCLDLDNAFRCECNEGYTGVMCEVSRYKLRTHTLRKSYVTFGCNNNNVSLLICFTCFHVHF